MKPKAILWDMDGTLLDTLGDLHASVNRVLTAFDLPVRTRDDVRRFLGNGAERLIRLAVPADTPETTVRAVLAQFAEDYSRHALDTTAPYPGIPEALEAFRQEGIVMAVVSNKIENAVEDLRKRFFPLISVAVGDVPGRPTKPSPEGSFEAMRRLGVTPEETLFIGDSEVDLLTAKNAGLPCISAGWGFREKAFLLAQGAEAFAETPADTVRIICGNSR